MREGHEMLRELSNQLEELLDSIHRQESGLDKTLDEILEVPVTEDDKRNWAEKYADKIATIPDSNGCRYYEKLNVRIGIICDDFFYDSIEAAAAFIYVTPENWKDVLEQGIDVFMFVSAWRGLHEEWTGLASITYIEGNKKRKTALELLNACHEKSIPTIFYSKEDPPNYSLFVDFAEQCDYIFTSAKECVPYYERDCRSHQVEAIPFGINPKNHNPIGSCCEGKEPIVLFAGSWMAKYPNRCQDLSMIFDGILASDYRLQIIDRNYSMHGNKYSYPETYLPYVSSAVDHKTLYKIHKLFDWSVNINSVKDSDTMFANRAFELEANGSLLLSNSSPGLNSILPNVIIVHDKNEVTNILDNMTKTDREDLRLAGIRAVMTGHTCYDRMETFLRPCGIEVRQPDRKVLVLVHKLGEKVKHSFDCQTYPHKELMEEKDVTEEIFASYDMVTWFDGKSDYGVFYLEDMVNGFKYTACDYITKDAWKRDGILEQGVEHNYVNRMKSKYRTLFWRSMYSWEFLREMEDERELENGYSIDSASYMEGSIQRQRKEKEYALSVIVPIYQNGASLYGKCFSSLRRSSIFWEMEILLVDDGSKDKRTLLIEEELKNRFPNVRLYSFGDGGSGSASRPRNKGVELATAEYVAFLDPDNEAVCDGYARMLKLAKAENRDLVLGNMYKCDKSTRMMNNYKSIVHAAQKEKFDDGIGDALIKSKFIAPSIQAMVIRRELLLNFSLKQVEGAIGEDTLFSWQLLQTAKRIQCIDSPIHTYFAQTAGSLTNTVSRTFFDKILILQEEKIRWLQENGLLEEFMKTRFDYYTVMFLLRKLSDADNLGLCARLVHEYLNFYKGHYRGTDSFINHFLELCESDDYVGAGEFVRSAFRCDLSGFLQSKEDFKENRQPNPRMQVIFWRKGSEIFLWNVVGTTGLCQCAWHIVSANEKNSVLCYKKYSSRVEFSYDFKQTIKGTYRIVASSMYKNKDENSNDVVMVKWDGIDNLEILKEKSCL